VRVATWNVNSLTARWPRVSAWVIEHQPDVLLMQETKQTDAKFPFAEFAEIGYESAHYGQVQWNGVAIVSRVGLEQIEVGLDGDEEARFISARCAGVRMMSCYVPNGRALDDPHYQYKLRWLESLRERLTVRALDEPLVVAGDFNIAPTDLDCWDPAALAGQTHVSELERAALAAVINTGLVDAVRTLHPSEPCFTWWDYRQASFGRGWGLRIDLVLLDEASSSTLRVAYVDREARKGDKPSDHAPVVVEFDEPGGSPS
jgi:exodeoxyribonuclease-3